METSVLWVNLLVPVFLLGLCHQSSAFPSTHHGRRYASYQRTQLTRSQSSSEMLHKQEDVPAERQENVNTIRVACYPDSLEILIKADMFGVGAPVDNNELRLGVEDSDFCRAAVSSRDEYRIVSGLMDCGTKHWMIEESLVYTNLLIYSPVQSPYGLIRMDEAVIPIECHYERKYNLSSSSLKPTWIPFMSTQAAVDMLAFDLKTMTDDWLSERSTNVFHFGDSISIEASVRVGRHVGLRVFLRNCVATLHPDVDSTPRYVFIENGCLVDSQLPGSRSYFVFRTQDDKLQLVIDAFRFHNDDRGELYITCQLNAVPVSNTEAPDKACTFANRRWRSADSNDYLCRYCQSQAGQTLSNPSKFDSLGFGKPKEPEASWRSGLQTNKVWEQEARISLTVLPGKQKSGLGPVGEIPPVRHKLSRPLTYGSQWRSGIADRIDLDKDVFTPDMEENKIEPSAADITDQEMALLPTLPSIPDLVNENEDVNETDHIDLQVGLLPEPSTPDLVEENKDDMSDLDLDALQKRPLPDPLSTPDAVENDEATEEDQAATLLEKEDPNVKMKSKLAELDSDTTAALGDTTPTDQVTLEVTALSDVASAELESLATNGPKK